LRFRRRRGDRFDRAKLDIAPRSAYLLSGEARWAWEHSIAAGDLLRFSITFRTMSDKGRKFAGGS
jgi:alkylated DNA repair dioxygenase AlkB